MDVVSFAELGFQGWLTIVVVVAVFACLLWERLSPAWLLLAAVMVLLLGGVLDVSQALSGFTNSAVLTVAVLFVVAGALRSTGAIRWVASWVLGRPRGAFVAQSRLVGISSSLSAFINNTPVVAMLTAAVEGWCRNTRISPSKLLIPLSYATILGGMCTLIGTSTNLIVLALMRQHGGLPDLHMFDPAWVGVPAALVGGVYLLTLGRWLLPDRRTALDQARDTAEFVLAMDVIPDGRVDGRSIVDARLRELPGAYLFEVQREHRILPAVGPDTVLEGEDRVVFAGTAGGLRALRQISGLRHAEDEVFKVGADSGRQFVEVVLSRLSPVVGQTLRGARFRQRYGAAVVAINRHGQQVTTRPDRLVLQAGDTLLLETTAGFVRRFSHAHDFIMVNLVDGTPPVQPRKALIALGTLAGMIVVNVVFHVEIFISAVLAALTVVLTGCINLRDAVRAIDYPLIVAIACALGIGVALSVTGVAAAVAGVLMQLVAGDPFWTLVMVYVLAVVFTELLTNNAAAVLMFPIGLAAAQQLGAQPMPFIIAVMIGASASFITPIGYQTNMMVYGPGGYRFVDYVRVGTPLSIVVGAVVLPLIPQVWPL